MAKPNENEGVEDTGVENESTEETSEGEEITHGNGSANRIAALERNQAALELLADPDVQAVIQARRAGKKVSVTADEDEAPAEETAEEPVADDLAADDPVRKTLERVDKLIGKRLDRMAESLDERLKSVEGLATEVRKRDVNEQVDGARKKFKDFNKYAKSILELSKDNPGLKVDQLYILAKHNSGDLRQAEQVTASEKPTHSMRGSPAGKSPKKPERPAGRKGFQDLLSESLKDLVIES